MPRRSSRILGKRKSIASAMDLVQDDSKRRKEIVKKTVRDRRSLGSALNESTQYFDAVTDFGQDMAGGSRRTNRTRRSGGVTDYESQDTLYSDALEDLPPAWKTSFSNKNKRLSLSAARASHSQSECLESSIESERGLDVSDNIPGVETFGIKSNSSKTSGINLCGFYGTAGSSSSHSDYDSMQTFDEYPDSTDRGYYTRSESSCGSGIVGALSSLTSGISKLKTRWIASSILEENHSDSQGSAGSLGKKMRNKIKARRSTGSMLSGKVPGRGSTEGTVNNRRLTIGSNVSAAAVSEEDSKQRYFSVLNSSGSEAAGSSGMSRPDRQSSSRSRDTSCDSESRSNKRFNRNTNSFSGVSSRDTSTSRNESYSTLSADESEGEPPSFTVHSDRERGYYCVGEGRVVRQGMDNHGSNPDNHRNDPVVYLETDVPECGSFVDIDTMSCSPHTPTQTVPLDSPRNILASSQFKASFQFPAGLYLPQTPRHNPLPEFQWANGEDMWRAMELKEKLPKFYKSLNRIENHEELEPRMRSILIDWLIEVSEVYRLHRETFHMAVDYVDRYLTHTTNVKKTQLQLTGITALFIAAKTEEVYPPRVQEFAYVTDGACSEEEILELELIMLRMLQWDTTPLTPLFWLSLYYQTLAIQQNQCSESTLLKTCFIPYDYIQSARLLDLVVLDGDCVRFPASILAASVFFYGTNERTTSRITGYTHGDVKDCIDWVQSFAQALNIEDEVRVKSFNNVNADDAHNIQTHVVNLDLMDSAHEIREKCEAENIDRFNLMHSSTLLGQCDLDNNNAIKSVPPGTPPPSIVKNHSPSPTSAAFRGRGREKVVCPLKDIN